MVVILLRHTTPAGHEGVCYGSSDLGLAATFADEATAALADLLRPSRILTSPLQRCAQLAARAGQMFGTTVHIDPALSEMDFGDWEGKPWSSVPKDQLDEWAADFFDARPHGGESVRMMQNRVQPVLAGLQRDEETTLVVTHAGVMKISAAMQGLPDPWNLTIPYGGVLQHG